MLNQGIKTINEILWFEEMYVNLCYVNQWWVIPYYVKYVFIKILWALNTNYVSNICSNAYKNNTNNTINKYRQTLVFVCFLSVSNVRFSSYVIDIGGRLRFRDEMERKSSLCKLQENEVNWKVDLRWCTPN